MLVCTYAKCDISIATLAEEELGKVDTLVMLTPLLTCSPHTPIGQKHKHLHEGRPVAL